MKICFAVPLLLFLYSCVANAQEVVVLKDTLDTAVQNGVRVDLTGDFLSSTPAINLGKLEQEYKIFKVEIAYARFKGTRNYDSFGFGFGEITNFEDFRTELFSDAYDNGFEYDSVGQETGLMSPTRIEFGFKPNLDKLIFEGFEIRAGSSPTNEFLFMPFTDQLILTNENIAIVLSSENQLSDFLDKGNIAGGLFPVGDFSSGNESQYAVKIYARSVAGTILLGDVNLDGSVDLLDVEPFVDLLTNGEFQNEADINQDGVVDLLDVAPFVGLLTGG